VSNLPNSRSDQLTWLEAHVDQWISKASELGIQVADATALKAKVTAARTKFNSAEVARFEAKGATQAWYSACSDMLPPARQLIAQIKTFAMGSEDPDAIYGIALMDPPQPPQPATAPAMPENINGSISTSGVFTMTWDAVPSGPSSGITFQITKQFATQGPGEWTIIGLTYDKQFIDPSFNPCGGNVSYRVQARRGNLYSVPSSIVSVNFGSPTGLPMVTVGPQTLTSTPQSKAA